MTNRFIKVFFNDREIILSNDLGITPPAGALCWRSGSTDQLVELVGMFENLSKIKHLYLIAEDLDSLFRDFQACFHRIDAAGGVVRDKLGRILVIYRRGTWDLPKGKAEKGENELETALREVEEECGLGGLVPGGFIAYTWHTYLHKGKWVLKKTAWFEMLYDGDDNPVPQLEEDIELVRWLNPKEMDLVYQNTYPSVKGILMNVTDSCQAD
jgi:8-oxo-dGTP pyrophosphatase MutT (NUDIX family)